MFLNPRSSIVCFLQVCSCPQNPSIPINPSCFCFKSPLFTQFQRIPTSCRTSKVSPLQRQSFLKCPPWKHRTCPWNPVFSLNCGPKHGVSPSFEYIKIHQNMRVRSEGFRSMSVVYPNIMRVASKLPIIFCRVSYWGPDIFAALNQCRNLKNRKWMDRRKQRFSVFQTQRFIKITWRNWWCQWGVWMVGSCFEGKMLETGRHHSSKREFIILFHYMSMTLPFYSHDMSMKFLLYSHCIYNI